MTSHVTRVLTERLHTLKRDREQFVNEKNELQKQLTITETNIQRVDEETKELSAELEIRKVLS